MIMQSQETVKGWIMPRVKWGAPILVSGKKQTIT